MNQLVFLWQIGPFHVTGYSLCVLAGVALAALATLRIGQRNIGASKALTLCLIGTLCAWAGARIVYVLTQLDTILMDTEYYGVPFILKPWEGGYTLYGAVLGGLAGAWLASKALHVSAGLLMDTVAPGAALALCCIRAGEFFTSQGLGHIVENEAFQRFPFAVYNAEWDIWQLPVFFFEALTALALFFVLMPYARRKRAPSTVAEIFLVLLSVSQILLESLREDEFIRFGFVRFSQLAAVIVTAAVLASRLARRIRRNGWKSKMFIRLAMFVLEIGVCIGVEFALDKSSINNVLLYAVMAVAVIGMGYTALAQGGDAIAP